MPVFFRELSTKINGPTTMFQRMLNYVNLEFRLPTTNLTSIRRFTGLVLRNFGFFENQQWTKCIKIQIRQGISDGQILSGRRWRFPG